MIGGKRDENIVLCTDRKLMALADLLVISTFKSNESHLPSKQNHTLCFAVLCTILPRGN